MSDEPETEIERLRYLVAELHHELSILNQALGDDHTAWVKYPTIQQKWNPVGNQPFELEIAHDGDLYDMIEAVKRSWA